MTKVFWHFTLRQAQAEERVVSHAELVEASVYFCSLPMLSLHFKLFAFFYNQKIATHF
jgi:hypothetical protein